jgi:ubiquinone/menaquinone biosynthesis C-methylase UbiE
MSARDSGAQEHLPSSWAGRGGRAWARRADWHEYAFAVFDPPLLDTAGLRSGDRVLEVGCGGGATTMALADAVGPSGRVVALDVSEPLCDQTRQRAANAGFTNVEVVVADAATFDSGGDRFDHVVSRFGVMFFDDPVAAFANLAGLLVPGGKCAFAAFRERARNPWVDLPTRILAAHLPDPSELGPEPQGFAFADPAEVAQILTDAGLLDVHHDEVNVHMTMGGGGGVEPASRQVSGQLLAAAILQRLPTDERTRALHSLRDALGDHLFDGEVRLRASAWIVTARAPGGR